MLFDKAQASLLSNICPDESQVTEVVVEEEEVAVVVTVV